MTLQLVTGPTNASKAGVVLGLVRRWAADGLRPVLVVPTGPDADRYRRELVRAGGGVAYDVTVVTFTGLVDEVRRALGLPAARLSAVQLDRVLASALAPIEPGRPLGGIAGRPGARRRLAILLEELTERGAGAEQLVEELESLDATEHRLDPRLVADLQRVLGTAARAGERVRGRDGAPLPTAAAQGRAVRTALGDRPQEWGGRPVAWYGFDDLTFAQQAMVRSLALAADVVVSLPYEDGRVATAARREVVHELRRSAVELSERGRSATGLLPLRAGSALLRDARVDRIVGPELVLAARDVGGGRGRLQQRLFEPTARVADDDPRAAGDDQAGPCDDVVLIVGGDARTEAEALVEELCAAVAELGIAWHDVAIAVRDAEGPTGARLERELRELGVAVARPRKIAVRRTAIGRALTAVARLAIGTGDADDVIAVLRAGSPFSQRDVVDRLAIALRRDGIDDGATATRRALASPTRIIGAGLLVTERPRGPEALLTVLEDAAGALERTLATVPGTAPGDDVERRALARIVEYLDQLRSLGRASGELLPSPAELAVELADLELRVGAAPGAHSGRVEIAPPAALRGRHLAVLAIADLREHAFPAPEVVDPLIDRDARAALSEAGRLSLGTPVERVSAERLLFAELVGRPTRRLILSRPRSAASGEPLPEAPFLEAVRTALHGLEPRTVTRDVSCVRPPTRRATAVAAPFGAQLDAAGRETVRRVLLERRRFTVGEVERLARCPVCWLVEQLGRAQDDQPLSESQIQGQLVHAVLEAALDVAAPTGTRYGDVDPAALVAAGRRALAQRGPRAVAGLPPHRRPVLLRRVEIGVSAVLTALPAWYGRAARRASEAGVGPDDEIPAIDLGDGAYAVGRIDRIDEVQLADGRVGVGVVDYKLGSGGAVPCGSWERTATLQVALYLHAVSTADAVATYGLYQPTSPVTVVPDVDAPPPARPPAGLALRGAVGDGRSGVGDLDEVAAIVAAAHERAMTIVAAAREGRVSPTPEGSVHGQLGRCDHPAIARLLP